MIPLLALALATGAAPACTAPTAIISAIPTPVAYTSVFDGTLWNGEKAHYQAAVNIPAKASPITVSYDSKAPKTVDAQIGPCGIIPTDAAAISPINAALSLALGAPSTLASNATWHSSVIVQVSQDQSVSVPVDVTYTTQPSGAVLLQGVGHASGTLNAYGTPFDLSYQSSALFSNGQLTKASSAAQEAVTAGPASQTMKLAWNVQRQE